VPRESLLVKVRARMAIHVRRPTHHPLEGEYPSVHRGRSMEFDDLREYVLGDNVKDIDWKATARAGRPLVKRYVAMRRHAVLLVADTGRGMAALADAESTKRDVAVLAAGLVGHAALRHGDSVGLLAGPTRDGSLVRRPFGRGEAHLERVLRALHDAVDATGPGSRLRALLDEVARRYRRRLIVVVLADDVDLAASDEQLLRRLAMQHELLWCTFGDAAITDPALGDRRLHVVGTPATVPAYLRAGGALHDDLLQVAAARERDTQALLARCGAAAVRLAGEAEVVGAVLELLDRQRLFGRLRR